MIAFSILNYSSAQQTADCLSDIISACGECDFQILVRDHSPASEIGYILAELKRKKIRDPDLSRIHFEHDAKNPGFGAGHNSNFCKAALNDNDIFVVLNNDIKLLDHSLIRTLGCVLTDRIIATCIIKSKQGIWYSGGEISRWSGATTVKKIAINQCVETQFVTGCFMAMRACSFERIKGFDERYFMYSEDIDFSIRATLSGHRLIVLPHEIWHMVGSGEKGEYSELYLYHGTKNRIICCRSHSLGLPFIRDIWLIFLYGVARILQLLWHSKARRRNIGAVIRGNIAGFLENR